MSDFKETILVKVKKNVDTRAFSFDSLQNSGLNDRLKLLSTLLKQKKQNTKFGG